MSRYVEGKTGIRYVYKLDKMNYANIQSMSEEYKFKGFNLHCHIDLARRERRHSKERDKKMNDLLTIIKDFNYV